MAGTRISKNWEPTTHPDEIKKRYPYIGDVKAAMEAFRNLHLSKGDTSHDWNALFLTFCDYRHRMSRIETTQQRHTDSMGLPLKGLRNEAQPVNDGGLRFLDQYEKHRADGLDPEAARRAALTDLQGDTE